MKEVSIFNNENLNLKVRTILNTDGSISINAEDTAIGFGWFEIKDGKEYIRWRTINNYLNEFGFSQQVAKEDYIPESLFYMLGMKANNKVALEFQKWLAIDVLPKLRKTGTYTTDKTKSTTDEKSKLTEAKLINAKVRMSNQLLKLSYVDTLSTEYKNILVSKATEVLTGEQLIPLPKSKQKTYSATEIGEMFGVSKQKIGLLSNKFKLKIEQYGEWYRSKSEYSSKEVDTWVYYDSVIPVFKELLNVEVGAFA